MKYINFLLFILLFLVTACGGFENEKIDTEDVIASNKLIIPPCLK